MNRYTISFLALCLYVPVLSMEAIKITTGKWEKEVRVDSKTTIAHIKAMLQDAEGMEPQQLHFYALEPKPWSYGFSTKRSEELDNGAFVVDVIDVYRTHTLSLMLSLPKIKIDNV